MNRAARRAAARSPRLTPSSGRGRIAEAIAEHDTLHRWDTVNGVDMLTVFTPKEVLIVASDTENEVQAFLAVSRYVTPDGATALSHAPITNTLDDFLNRFPKRPMARSTQRAWDGLPPTEQRQAQQLRLMRSIIEREQRATDATVKDAEHMTLAERRISRCYRWDETTRQPVRSQ